MDNINSGGQKVQIKARRVTPDTPYKQLSTLRNYDAHEFDYLIAVIGDYARFSQNTNAHLITIKGHILLDKRVVDIKKEITSSTMHLHNKPPLSN
ncbi:hypothetical protein [Proteus mirabilis]|uniref:hypothetical protein n=1 Tax=Proteus mirabilis TaxID=584 RepID=UPI0015827542|nr:hypothetical protein [Proteus mirabilis]MBG2817882.1 hypothetical protein [Proteus mirabilis]MBG2866824.1 hypothetical protein [Proteus mirabilis]MBL1399838.1 hypothetical protein [Proteus mirabilis]MCL8567924.1 hypothetical protein [Proteus mirabilis]MCL8629063.1 hypothetical protein [Proteus mirabilis]